MDLITPFLNWIIQCPEISSNKLFLNAVTAQDKAIQIVSQEIISANDKKFVDGSVQHTVLFTIFDYKSISFNQMVKTMVERNENVADLLSVSAIADWVVEQNDLQNYPDFGSNYEVQEITPIYRTPGTPTIDNNNLLAKYSIPISCEVIKWQ